MNHPKFEIQPRRGLILVESAGYHELEFRMENAASYGMLFCELVTPQGRRMIKMVTAR